MVLLFLLRLLRLPVVCDLFFAEGDRKDVAPAAAIDFQLTESERAVILPFVADLADDGSPNMTKYSKSPQSSAFTPEWFDLSAFQNDQSIFENDLSVTDLTDSVARLAVADAELQQLCLYRMAGGELVCSIESLFSTAKL